MQDFLIEYEEKNRELEADLRVKQEIIDEFQESQNFGDYFGQNEGLDFSPSQDRNTLDLGALDEGFGNNGDQLRRMTALESQEGGKLKLVDLIKQSRQENEDLKKSIDKTTSELNSFQEREKEDQERIQDLEDTIDKLRTHCIVFEKEKFSSEKKYKNLQFKIQGFKNEINNYKDSCDELEDNNLKLEEEYKTLLKQNEALKIKIRNVEYLNRKYQDQNPNLDISRLSFNL